MRVRPSMLALIRNCALGAAALAGIAAQAAPLKVGLVLDKGGRDDKSFNSSAFAGATQAKEKLGIQLTVVEATDDNAMEPLLRAFAQKDFDLIIGVGVAQAEAVKKVATAFPQRRFAIVDAQVDAPNVRSLLFEEHEGSFLVGALAALAAPQAKKFGFIGGMDIPLIRRFERGYEAGVKKINPQAKVVSNYVGVTSDSWNNPPKAKELALAQYSGGVEVVFAAAGASGAGLFDAAEERQRLAIGVDSNQNWIKPGRVLTSMLKRVDVAIFSTVEDLLGNRFTAGTKRYGLVNSGVDYALDQNNAKLITPELKTKVDALKADIVAGKVKVPDYYQQKK
jgi:basic membrane protein A